MKCQAFARQSGSERPGFAPRHKTGLGPAVTLGGGWCLGEQCFYADERNARCYWLMLLRVALCDFLCGLPCARPDRPGAKALRDIFLC